MRTVRIMFDNESKEFLVEFCLIDRVEHYMWVDNMHRAANSIAEWLIEGTLPEKKG